RAKAASIVPETGPRAKGVGSVPVSSQSMCETGADLAEGDPALVDQQLDGAVFGFVVHLAAALDPVTQIDRVQAQACRLTNLPENCEAPQAALFFMGVVEGVDRRKTVRQYIGDRESQQAAFQAKLVKAAEGQIANQERLELVAAGWIHVSIGMPLLDVVRVKRVILLAEAGTHAGHRQVGITLQDAPLLSIEADAFGWNARWNAGCAALAMRAIKMIAAAPETHFRQFRIDLHIHRLAGVEKQGRRLFARQIAAGVRLGCVEPEASQ